MTDELLRIEHLSKQFGIKLILDDVSLSLNRGERFALVGENGAGKTTLARIILGQELPDQGMVRFAPHTVVGYLPQEVLTNSPITIADYIAQAVGDLVRIEAHMHTLEAHLDDYDALAEYGDLQETFMRLGGYELPYRTEQVMAGLGIAYLDGLRTLDSLSGGEKTRVHLASLLLKEPQLLILDEPTNHLDFEGITWLEQYLTTYPHALLLITHDRTFINRVATHIVELSATRHTLAIYHGDYDEFLRQRDQQYQKELALFEAQRDEMVRLKRLVKTTTHNHKQKMGAMDGDKLLRFKMEQTAQATRSKNIRDAKQRLDTLERDKLDNPSHQWTVDFRFHPLPLISAVPIQLAQVCKTLGEHTILDRVDGQVNNGQRVVLVAPNGNGKTTLLRLIAGLLTLDSGRITVAPSVRLGYLDQEGESLNPHQRVLDCYRECAPTPMTDAEIVTELHRSGLFADSSLSLKRVGDLSVGQRRKLGIARLIASQANVLLLDEPTNHLDLLSVEALEASLLAFEGAILAVSHDRRFIEKVATHRWHLANGQLIGEGL